MNIYLNNEKVAEVEKVHFRHPKEKEIKAAIGKSLAAVDRYSESLVNIHYNEFMSLINLKQKQRILSDDLLPIDKKLRKKMLWQKRIKTMAKS